MLNSSSVCTVPIGQKTIDAQHQSDRQWAAPSGGFFFEGSALRTATSSKLFNESFRFRHGTNTAKARTKSREQAKKSGRTGEATDEPF